MKKTIMMSGEASFIPSGFGTIQLELCKRLHESGKYNIIEYSSFGRKGDERSFNIPWKYETCMPELGNEQETKIYNSNPKNAWGEWKFEENCLKHKPDIVFDMRDTFCFDYQERSPYRKHFNWVICPAVDSQPQSTEWISTHLNADAVFGYSDWGLEVLKKQSCGKIKTKCETPPGVDTNIFFVRKDKKKHKEQLGIDPNSLIVGTVMRNQKRKLYPDLLKSFSIFLEKAPLELSKKTYLYLHTAYPDVGWNIPLLIKEFNIGHKTILTYLCKNCGLIFSSFYQDSVAICKRCKQLSAGFPNVSLGVSREVLSEIYSLFDVYVQYANSEAQGMPQIEAASCGVPVMAVDYSAMSDVVRKLNGIPINVLGFSKEVETHCDRAIPDNNDFVDKLIKFFSLPESIRRNKGYAARQGVEKYYTWDRTVSRLIEHFDSVEPKNTWLSPAQYHNPQMNIPSGLNNEEFVRWGILNIACEPKLLDSNMSLRMIRDLNWGVTLTSGQGALYHNDDSASGMRRNIHQFNRENVINILYDICNKYNYWERKRVESINAK